MSTGSRNDESGVIIYYRKQRISEPTAQKTLEIFDSAIKYLLSTGGWKATNSTSKSVGCANEGLPTALWHKLRLMSIIPKFPPLPPSHSHRVEREWCINLETCHAAYDENTAWVIVQAAWSIVLSKYTGSCEVAFGTAMEHRGAPIRGGETQTALAYAILPIHAKVDASVNVQSFLDQLENQITEFGSIGSLDIRLIARINEAVIRDNEMRTLLVVRPTRSEECYQYGHDPADITGLREDSGNDRDFEGFAMVLLCRLNDRSVYTKIKFDSTVIAQSILERMAQSFDHILQQFSTPRGKSARVGDIQATNAQQLQDIWNWNARLQDPVKACVHDLIAARARKQPKALAICAWDGDTNYSELDTISSKLAFRLIGDFGIRPGQVVPLCFEKSKWMPLAIISVMKAGGISVALDTNLPDERLQSILSQTQAKIILSSQETNKIASRLADGTVIMTIQAYIDGPPCPNTHGELPTVDPAVPVYIVFTSGSTGKPKGVIISHQNASSAITYQQTALGFKGMSRVYDFASYAFDATWLTFLNTLTSGGCLCIPSEEARKNDIAGSMRAMQVNYAHLIPTVARVLRPSVVPNLKTLVLGGEPMTQEDINIWGSHVDLYNNYGPAECTPAATSIMIYPQTKYEGAIGRGWGLVTWVVDPDGQQLAPIGGAGELWLEGPLVGLGYLNDKDKTSAAFVKNLPWLLHGAETSPGREGRLYRTGDQVKYDETGSLIFIGRNDSQIKIRGQRVELSEVEYHVRNVLAACKITASVVAELIRLIDSPSRSLVAFVSIHHDKNESSENHAPSSTEINGILKAKLGAVIPAYMIPRLYISLDAFPITASGKTDRRKLQEMGSSLTLGQLAMLKPPKNDQRLPITEKERLLQQLWATVLGVESSRISADENFLHVGGDSVRAMQLVAAAREQQLSLTVADVFKQPRLCDLAEIAGLNKEQSPTTIDAFSLLKPNLSADEARLQAADMCGVEGDRIVDIFPCTPLQEGLIAMTKRRSGDYIFRLTLELEENVDVD